MGAFKEPLNITQDQAWYEEKGFCPACANKGHFCVTETIKLPNYDIHHGHFRCDYCVNVYEIYDSN